MFIQDTVVAMSALAKLAEKIISNNNDASVTFTYKEGYSTTINVNRANSMILQKHEVSTGLYQLQESQCNK